MRILIVSDIHGRSDWWHWIIDNSFQFQGVVLAGDLIDMCAGADRIAEACVLAEASVEHIRENGTPVFVCEGNHDAAIRWNWMHEQLGRFHLGHLLIQTLPDTLTEETLGTLKVAHKISQAEKLPWIVVDHYPPLISRTNTDDFCLINRPAAKVAPDIVISGHCHDAPFRPPEHSWHDRVGATLCLNPGVRETENVPCRIVLDTAEKTATWYNPWRWERISYSPSED